jgi:ribonuclease HI
MNTLENLLIHSDGGARGNPGPAAIGVVLYSVNGDDYLKIGELKEYIGETTNNVAEYTALLKGLEEAKKLGYSKVHCNLDSELVVKQLNGLYKIKEPTLQGLAQKVLVLRNSFKNVIFAHVPRAKNAEADKLVNEALDAREKEITPSAVEEK